MFHVLLVLPALAAIGFVLLIPFCVGGLLQLLLSIFCKRVVFLIIPLIMGGAGVISSVLYFRDTLPVASYFWYWGAYFGMVLLILFAVCAIKKIILREVDKRFPVIHQAKEDV